jgi:seryl-tRNA synthetase
MSYDPGSLNHGGSVMLDIRRIRENEQQVRSGIESRGVDSAVIGRIVALDLDRRRLLQEVEALKNQRNTASKEIGVLKKKGEDTAVMQVRMREIGDEIASLDGQVRQVDAELNDLLMTVPNVPHQDVPRGTDASANRFVREYGEKRKFDFQPKPHVEIGKRLGILDLARATKMTGTGFPLFVGAGARLERALIQFMLDLHVSEHGFTEMCVPVLCNSAAMTGTGQLPKMAEDMYRVQDEDLYLIPTAEVPLTNYYREEIIDQPLPIYLTAYTPCFRREAGAAGKDTRGIIRVHQFDKVELVKFVEPETSSEELESLVANAEQVLQRLDLHYRVLELCSGDISFSAARCYDLELWTAGQNDWLEVSSCSSFEDFQARRAGIRYKDEKGKTRFVHTLNGSGVALARLMVAILENGQQADGSVVLPAAIVPYMGGVDRIEPLTP